jgi:hypothetical protein
MDSDSVVVDFYPSLDSFDLGTDISLCPGETIVLKPGIDNASYLWQDLSTADSLLIDQGGTYSVTISNPCTSIVDTVHVVFQNLPPDVELGAQVALCEGQTFTLQAGISGVNYLWSDSTTASELQVSLPGSYAITVSNACGVDTDTILVLDAGAVPIVSLGSDISFCPGEEVELIPAHQDVLTWLWQDGSVDTTFAVTTSNVITVEVSNACGTDKDTLIATLLEATVDFNLGVDTSICPGETLILQPGTIGLTLSWSDGSTGTQLEVDDEGIYYAINPGVCGITTDTIDVDLLDPAPALDLGADQSICPGDVILIDPGINNVDYLWQDGSTGDSYSTTVAGEIILTISNACGTSTDSLLITESNEGPQLNLGPDVTGCTGDTVTIQAGVGNVTYTWQDGSTNSFFETSSNAELILYIANACGEDSDTIDIQFIAPPDPYLGPDTLLCDNDKLTLTSNADQQTMSTWQDGTHGSNFVVTLPGVYSLQLSNLCGDITDFIDVSYLSSPAPFSLGPDVELCPGESITLQAPATLDNLLWQDGSHGTTIIADKEQVYTLDISNACGSVQDQVVIALDLDIPAVQFDSLQLCTGEILTLDATQPFDAQYTWSTGANESIHRYSIHRRICSYGHHQLL